MEIKYQKHNISSYIFKLKMYNSRMNRITNWTKIQEVIFKDFSLDVAWGHSNGTLSETRTHP